MNVNEEYQQKIYRLLSENETFFEYNMKDDTISVSYDNQFVLFNEKFDIDKFGLELDDENRGVLLNFKALAMDSCSKEQASFKCINKGIEKYFLIETFNRNTRKDTIYGTVKNLSKVFIEQERLIELSKIDSLTGLRNRGSIKEYVNECIETKSFFILTMLDIDFFKEINDTYGHIVGDSVLEDVARKLKEVVTELGGDVGRIGGDEFMLVVPTDHLPLFSDMRKVSAMVRDAIGSLQNSRINTKAVSATVGSCSYPLDGLDYNTLYTKADKALYRGKAKGRACYIVYNHVMHKDINTDTPLTKTSENNLASVDFSVFVNDLLNSLLDNPSRQKALSKFEQIAIYTKVDRITLYKHDGLDFKVEYSWTAPIYAKEGNIEVLDFKSFYQEFQDGILVVNDIFDYARSRDVDFVKVPPFVNSFLTIPVGVQRTTDYFLMVEIFGNRRIWVKNQISTLKIISKIISTFYLRG